MKRIALGVLFCLSSMAALAQTTTCGELPGGLIRCSTPQVDSPIPSVTNCTEGIGSISCSQTQRLPAVQPLVVIPPPPTLATPVAVPNFLQEQQDEIARSRQRADAMTEQFHQREYQEQQLDLQRAQVELLEQQQEQRAENLTIGASDSAGKAPSQQIVDCGSDRDCDTGILHAKGRPMAVTGENWLDAIHQPQQSQVHVMAMIMAGHVLYKWNGQSQCAPPNIHLNQGVAIAKLYLEHHPELWHYPALNLIARSFGDVWPCAKSKPSVGK